MKSNCYRSAFVWSMLLDLRITVTFLFNLSQHICVRISSRSQLFCSPPIDNESAQNLDCFLHVKLDGNPTAMTSQAIPGEEQRKTQAMTVRMFLSWPLSHQQSIFSRMYFLSPFTCKFELSAAVWSLCSTTLLSQNRSCVLASWWKWVLTWQEGFLFSHTTPFATKGLRKVLSKGFKKSLCDFTRTTFVQCENPVLHMCCVFLESLRLTNARVLTCQVIRPKYGDANVGAWTPNFDKKSASLYELCARGDGHLVAAPFPATRPKFNWSSFHADTTGSV